MISSVEQKSIFLARTTPIIENLLIKIEISINNELSPNLKKNPAHNKKFKTILFPIMEGCLYIFKSKHRFRECERSVQLSSLLVQSLPKVELKREQIVQEI